MAETKASERRLAAHRRKLRALALREQGLTYREIAERVGYASQSSAHDAVMTAMQETLREPAEAVRQLELQRLDKMLDAVWPAALGGHLIAQAHVLRLMERRARYLGLDAPARVDIEHRVRVLAEQLGLDAEQAISEANRLLREYQRAASG